MKVTSMMFAILTALMIGEVQADTKAGKKVFNKCKACHVINKAKHRAGPSLKGIMGRKAGTVEGFKRYSKALKESGVTWNVENLAAYLKDPKGFIPKNRMTFRGLKKQKDIDAVIAYIQEASK